jgi:hypothetical protein
MRRIPIFACLALTAVILAVVAHASGRGSTDSFRLDDASAACRTHGATLVCRSLAASPAIAISAAGAPHAVREAIWWDASTPVLDSWQGSGLRCSAQAGEIVCTNAAGAGISAGPAGIAASL